MVGDQNLCAANQGHKFKTGTQESDLAQGSVARHWGQTGLLSDLLGHFLVCEALAEGQRK